MRPARIVFYGNFGAGNLGNEVTLQTAIEETARRLPGVQLLCVCTDPQDVRTRHGIEAAAAMSRDSDWSWSGLSARPTDVGSPAARTSRRAVVARVGRILFRRVPREFAHWYQMLRIMARSDLFLVPGTGIVTDGSCGAFGWPYDMFKLTLLARLCGKRVVYLSVGAGPFRYRLGCWFIRRSLGLAHYRSYRDVDSKRRLAAIGFDGEQDPVCPDLVFGLSRAHLAEARTGTGLTRIVGLGLKDYAAPLDTADARSYHDYLGVMADFVTALQAQGHTVRLIIGDAQYDTRVREDLIALLKARGASATAPGLLSDPVPTVNELLAQLRETDAVISPRFHNLVLALLLNKPVIALSDLPKVTALLADLGLERYCLSLEGLTSADLADRFAQLEGDSARLKSHIGRATESYRRAVDAQYESVYGEVASLKSIP